MRKAHRRDSSPPLRTGLAARAGLVAALCLTQAGCEL
jgi:hypothetical protein